MHAYARGYLRAARCSHAFYYDSAGSPGRLITTLIHVYFILYVPQDGHVIPGLIHKCYIAKSTGTDFVIWGR